MWPFEGPYASALMPPAEEKKKQVEGPLDRTKPWGLGQLTWSTGVPTAGLQARRGGGLPLVAI